MYTRNPISFPVSEAPSTPKATPGVITVWTICGGLLYSQQPTKDGNITILDSTHIEGGLRNRTFPQQSPFEQTSPPTLCVLNVSQKTDSMLIHDQDSNIFVYDEISGHLLHAYKITDQNALEHASPQKRNWRGVFIVHPMLHNGPEYRITLPHYKGDRLYIDTLYWRTRDISQTMPAINSNMHEWMRTQTLEEMTLLAFYDCEGKPVKKLFLGHPTQGKYDYLRYTCNDELIEYSLVGRQEPSQKRKLWFFG
jgi:hypothetical protein